MGIRPCALTTFENMAICVDDVARWFLENGLPLNLNNTEAVLFDTPAEREKIPTAGGIDVAGTVLQSP